MALVSIHLPPSVKSLLKSVFHICTKSLACTIELENVFVIYAEVPFPICVLWMLSGSLWICLLLFLDDPFLMWWRNKTWGWSDGSVVKSTGCSLREPEFDSQQPHGDSQPSLTVISEDPMPSSDFLRHQALWRCTDKTPKHTKQNPYIFSKTDKGFLL